MANYWSINMHSCRLHVWTNSTSYCCKVVVPKCMLDTGKMTTYPHHTFFVYCNHVPKPSPALASFPGSHAWERKHWSCAGVESLVFFVTWKVQKIDARCPGEPGNEATPAPVFDYLATAHEICKWSKTGGEKDKTTACFYIMINYTNCAHTHSDSYHENVAKCHYIDKIVHCWFSICPII